MRTVAQGDKITLRVTFQLADGQLVDPDADTVLADVLAPDGTVVVADAVPVHVETGIFSLAFAVDAAAALGTWQVQWSGLVGGQALASSEEFEVVVPSSSDTTAGIVRRLRRLLGERIPLGKTEGDTRFLDEEIAEVYYANGEDLNKAMAELWLSKAAYFGDFTDVNESGTNRALSQLGKAAMAQANLYASRVNATDTAWAATYRAMAVSFSPYCGKFEAVRIRPGATVLVPYEPQRLWTGTL